MSILEYMSIILNENNAVSDPEKKAEAQSNKIIKTILITITGSKIQEIPEGE